MRWKLRIGDVVHGTPRDPFAALDQRRRVNLNNALATHLVPDKSDAAVLAWFWPIPWRSPCLVQFRDKGDEDSRRRSTRTTRWRRGPRTSRRAGPATGNFPKLGGIKMRASKKSAASLLGAAAVAGLMSASAAQAAPAGRVTLSDGNLINVIQRGDYGQYDLHAYPAGPGWVGKGAVSPHAGYRHRR
jgi:hypothetical protein